MTIETYVDNTKQSPLTTISIGPGIRGIERGIESTGARLNHIAYVEIEAFIIENLVAEMEQGLLDPAVIWSDCKTFPSELFRGKVNLLLAGYPCHPFSNAGKRKGADDPRHLWPHIERTIDIIRPDICLFENVRGHITLGLREVIESLEGLGYKVHWGIFSAEETGASHKRERVFIRAVRKDRLEDSTNNGFKRSIQKSTIKRDIDSISIKGTSQLDNSSGNGLESNDSIPTGSNSAELAGSTEMGNPESQLSKQPRNTRTGHTGFTNDGSPELADTHNSGSRQDFESGQLRSEGIEQPSCNSWRAEQGEVEERQERSVSRPGQPQQAWEHPRVISRAVESSVGMSANGYNFREDLLRALGNSVYPPTAALAWKTLSEEHGL